jgi:beta-N-acetylhexosaminidase
MLSLLIIGHSTYAQRSRANRAKNQWVDSVYSQLIHDERIGQLFMVAAYSGGKNYNEEQIMQLLDGHQVGGLIFMQGGPARQALLTNKYQRMAHVPLLIGMDAEWGLGMRLDSVKNFPRQMMLSATRDTELVYKTGAAIAAQCKRLGVHIDFAPDMDVNNNPLNPVINSRSFGENKNVVARMGTAMMRGMQDNGIIACAKHFPGHGNTSVDSHQDLPLIPSTYPQLDTLELFPFRKAIAAGVKSIMVAHLEVPALDTTAHLPTTLSKNVVTDLLKDRLGFKGLVITDALNMQGVTKYFQPGDPERWAFIAGNDILLMSPDVPTAIGKIKAAMDSGLVTEEALEVSVKKILGAKYDMGLNRTWRDIDPENIVNDLNKQVMPIRAQVAKAAVTLVRDDNQVLKKMTDNMRIGYIGVNASGSTPLYEALQDKFGSVKAEWLPKGSAVETAQALLNNIPQYSAVIIGVHNTNFGPSNNYGLDPEAIAFLLQASCRNNVMVVLPGNAYVMQYFCGGGSIMVGYENDTLSELAIADVLMGRSKAKGRLPVTACLNGQSVCAAPPRIPALGAEPGRELTKVAYPGDAGVIVPEALNKLDMSMARNIAEGVFPGCRILAAKNGKVFYDKAFGYMTYNKQQPVDTNTLYDLASCTKALATTIAVMKLYEQGKLDLLKTLGDYLPQARGTNKERLYIKDILLHQAGLKSYIPFFAGTVDANGKLKSDFYRSVPGNGFDIPVARGIYLLNEYKDVIWDKIYASGIENKGKMVYSDLDYYFLAAVVEAISGKPIDKFVEEEFYRPMGLKRILYNPLKRFDSTDIAPTEIDLGFRNILLRGTVHDPGAAMMGGVAGHAGLFGTAHDVAAVFQMLLNKGLYGGKRYLKSATVDLFTAYGSDISHRGLGFDKPAPEVENAGPAGDRTTGYAFGHQGFTGTCVWADPGTGVVFVFLSNRVYPSSANTKITKWSVRTISQDYIYESLGIPVNTQRPEVYKQQLGQ